MEISRHTPEFVLRRLAAHPVAPDAPIADETAAAVLWADISGFTRLTERLVAEGPMGVETLTEYLNTYFTRLVAIIHAHGGDIVQFEGDAVLCVWRMEGDASLDLLALRALQCAADIQRQMRDYPVGDGVTLSQRVAVGAGQMRFLWVGGVLARWTVVAAGDPLPQVQRISHSLPPGEVVASPEVWALVGARCRGRVLPGGAAHVQAVTDAVAPRALERTLPSAEAERAVRVFLAGAVLARLHAGQGRWLAELRTVTVLFVHLPDLDPVAPDILAVSQTVTEETQHAIYRWGGSIDKISMADKGATLLAGFGIPPLAHEDDPTRAVRAALDIVGRLAAIGVRASVGVTTGQVFCGLVGSEARCEYTTLGRAVNLASRIMQIADGGVLTDEATWQASRGRLGYTPLDTVHLAGVPDPVAIFRPTGELLEVVRERTEMVGRALELDAISARLQDLVRQRTGGALAFEGEAGIGKSRLVLETTLRARALHARMLVGEASSIERETPYFAWRDIMSALLGLSPAMDADAVTRAAEAALAFDARLAGFAPLLDSMLPFDLADNEVTAGMPGEVRAANLHDMIVALMSRAAASGPLVVVIEDVHWLDSASWTLAERVARDAGPLLLVLATRPMADPLPAVWSRLLEHPDTVRLVLGNLSSDETLQLVCQRLGVVNLPDDVGRLLTDKSGGNPFFSEELAFSLRDTGLLLIHDGTCGLAPGADLDSASLPDTVQGAVISRVDRLSPAHQLLLKVASVIGREFAYRILAHVYPVEETGDDVAALLPALLDLDLVLAEGDVAIGPDAHYSFKHAIGQEAIYGLMLFKQRRELHRRVAEWYERRPANELVALYPLLAHHWSKAEEKARALEYLHKAGDSALEGFANVEAARFFERALALCEAVPDAGAVHLLGVSGGLAEASFRNGRFDACLAHGQRALAILGATPARSTLTTIFGLLRAVSRQLLRAALPRLFGGQLQDGREDRLAATRLFAQRAEIAIYTEDALKCVYSALRALNLSEPAGPSAELARAYAVMTIIIGAAPMPRVADAWTDRAVRLARELDQPLDRGFVLCRCGAYNLYRARWQVTRDYTTEARALGERLGDRRLREEALAVSQFGHVFQGAFGGALPVLESLVASARGSGNAQTLGWGRSGRAYVLARLGRPAEALHEADQLEAWTATCSSSEQVLGLAGLTAAHLAAGDLDTARQYADRANALLGRPIAYWLLLGIEAAADVYAALHARGDADALPKLARMAKLARSFGKVFVFGESAGLYLTGVHEAVRGRAALALPQWQRCIERSEALGTRFELMRAHRALASHLPEADPERALHAARADAVYAELAGDPGLSAAPA